MSGKSSSATISDRPGPSAKQGAADASNPSISPAHNLAPDALESTILLDNPVDSQASRINEAALRRICSIHGIPFTDVLVPSRHDRPHLPPVGYTACNKFMCWMGSVPPFNLFLRDVLQYIDIAPSQLHPNGHAFLYGTYLLFMAVFSRPPTPGDIRYIYMFKRRKDSPSFIFLEPYHKCQILTGACSKFALYKQEWFYVRCPSGFARRWVEGSINPRPEGRGYSDAVDAIRALPAEDRDIRAIISNESLSGFGLLAPDRRVSLPEGVTIPKPPSGKGKKLAGPSSRRAPVALEEGERREGDAPDTQGENVGPAWNPAIEVQDIETSSSPSKGKKKLKYTVQKEKVGDTSKPTPIPPEKEASSQRLESSLRGLSNLSIPEDILNYGFDDPEALKFSSPARGDVGVQLSAHRDNTPISKDKRTGDMGRSHGLDRLQGSSIFHHSGRDSGSGRRRDRGDYEDRDNRPRESSHRKKAHYQSPQSRDLPPATEPDKEKSMQKGYQSDAAREQHSSSSSTRQVREPRKRTEFSKPPPPAPAVDPTVAEKMVDLKAKFPKICFDGLKFLPAIHHIPGHVKQSAIACNNDVYVQHDAFVHLVEKISEVSVERQHEIDRLTLEADSDKKIIKLQDEELASYKLKLEAAEQGAKDTAEAVTRLEVAHKKELDEAVQRSGALALEKDSVQKERDALAIQVKELKEQLSKEKEDKIAAQEESQRYCDEIVATRLLKAKLDGELAGVERMKDEAREEGKRMAEEELDSRLGAAAEAGREEVKSMFDPLIAEYGARVLMHRDLTFLGDGYHESLAEAWETLIKIKKVESGSEEIDEDALVKEFLRGNEPSDLSVALALYGKGSSPSKEKNNEAGPSEADTTTPHIAAPYAAQSAGRSTLDPFEQHASYDPEDPGLGVHVLSPILEGETPRATDSQPDPGCSDTEPTPRSDDAKEEAGKTSDAAHAEVTPGPDAQVIGALNDDKLDTSSSAEGSDEVKITGASEHTSEMSMKDRLADEEKRKVKVKVESEVLELTDPRNRPLKIILPGRSKPLDVPSPTPDSVSLASKKSKKKREGEESSETPKADKKKKSKK